MWLLETNALKARKYAEEIYKQNSFSFDNTTGLKKQCPRKLQDTKSFNYLTKSVFDKYLSSEPNMLLQLHQDLFSHLFSETHLIFNQKHFAEYRQDVNNGRENIRHSEYSVITEDELDAIKHIFNYSSYISGNSPFSYYLAE